MKSKVVVFLLAFFLGGFGAHKFYLGKPLQGFIYLVLCWTYVPAIIALIEGIVYLCTNDREFQAKYGGATAQQTPEIKSIQINNKNNLFKKNL